MPYQLLSWRPRSHLSTPQGPPRLFVSHNAEFQEDCTKYIQFGSTFNLLRAATSLSQSTKTPSALLGLG
ncbi:hypothetical protein BDM02DRAFT_3194127 [Thelephora ganbajun]|uniref:Uncharacterized protein n=1 Tax=Thelephora ganbajun TaxID=370292 RepID=A0ACB6YXS2_THEGA|nr:hypothetical protein BDM02DRAFT_3194127 [Thelephora ganbajun]